MTNKAQSIAQAEAGAFAGTSFISQEAKVRVYGDAAVITSLDTVIRKVQRAVSPHFDMGEAERKMAGSGWQGTPVMRRQ